MISLTMVETACRAWPVSTRDRFSRSSLEIRLRCISDLNFSRLSCSTLYHPFDHLEIRGKCTNNHYPNKLNRFFLSWVGDKLHAVLAICRITREMGESSSASGVAESWARRTAG